jgi:ubiquinone/menaquinone biosynthesis C-methylase UbiE
MTDWGRGSYELTASQSAPVAPLVIDAAEPVENLKLLDLACGTGNAALVGARRDARVTGLDGAPRLLEVAAGRAEAEDLRVDWIEGDFHELPFAEDSFDVVTSVFGLIFAERPEQATAEVARILGPNGRLAITTWLDEGPMAGIQSENLTRRTRPRHSTGATGTNCACCSRSAESRSDATGRR